jgi:hypothetical protein
VNEAVAIALGDRRLSPITGEYVGPANNLSRELSADGATTTHMGGHAWLSTEQAKELSQIPNLTIQAAALDGQSDGQLAGRNQGCRACWRSR